MKKRIRMWAIIAGAATITWFGYPHEMPTLVIATLGGLIVEAVTKSIDE